MYRCILIGPDEEPHGDLANAIADFQDVKIVDIFAAYPAPDDLLQSIRVHKPQFLFLSVKDFAQVEILVRRLDDLMLGFPVLAFGGHLDVDAIRKLMRIGVRQYLPSPIQRAELGVVLDDTEKYLKQHPPPPGRVCDLYAFLPAKPGVGTSTIAVSTSSALSNDLGVHTLLLDCDLDAGTIKFLLKLKNPASLLDAIEHAKIFDEDLLSQVIGKWEKLDVINAGALNPPASVDLSGLQRVLAIARTQYEVICADLPSNLSAFAIGLLRESTQILLVTTPEVIPLHLARERIRRLVELGLKDRIRLLVNRKPGGTTNHGENDVAQLVGMPVSFSFPNDYPGVQSSILAAKPVAPGSTLGESIMALASALTAHPLPNQIPLRKKFLEFFHVPGGNPPNEVSPQ